MPPMGTFSPDTIGEKERVMFIEWYNKRLADDFMYKYRDEMIKYCKQALLPACGCIAGIF